MRTRFRYVLFCSIGDFRNTLDGAGTPNTGLSPPAVLTGRPLCLRRLTARQGRFNARTETRRVYHYPGMRVMAPNPPRLVVRSVAAPPIPPFFLRDHGQLTFTRLSFRATYQTYPVDLFNSQDCCQPAEARRNSGPLPYGNIVFVEICLKLRHIFLGVRLGGPAGPEIPNAQDCPCRRR